MRLLDCFDNYPQFVASGQVIPLPHDHPQHRLQYDGDAEHGRHEPAEFGKDDIHYRPNDLVCSEPNGAQLRDEHGHSTGDGSSGAGRSGHRLADKARSIGDELNEQRPIVNNAPVQPASRTLLDQPPSVGETPPTTPLTLQPGRRRCRLPQHRLPPHRCET